MHEEWRPRFVAGDRVYVVCGGLRGLVVRLDPEQQAYLIEVNDNPEFRLLCTDDELGPDRIGVNTPEQMPAKHRPPRQGP